MSKEIDCFTQFGREFQSLITLGGFVGIYSGYDVTINFTNTLRAVNVINVLNVFNSCYTVISAFSQTWFSCSTMSAIY